MELVVNPEGQPMSTNTAQILCKYIMGTKVRVTHLLNFSCEIPQLNWD